MKWGRSFQRAVMFWVDKATPVPYIFLPEEWWRVSWGMGFIGVRKIASCPGRSFWESASQMTHCNYLQCEALRWRSSSPWQEQIANLFLPRPDTWDQSRLTTPSLPWPGRQSSLMGNGVANSKGTHSNLPCQVNPNLLLCKRAAQKINFFKQLYSKRWPLHSKNEAITEKKLEDGIYVNFTPPAAGSKR